MKKLYLVVFLACLSLPLLVAAQNTEKPKEAMAPPASAKTLGEQLVETNNQIVLKSFKYEEKAHKELFLKALEIWASGSQDKSVDAQSATEVAIEGMISLYPGVSDKLAEIVVNEKVDMEKRGDALHYLAFSADKKYFDIYKKLLVSKSDAFKYESLSGLAILGDKDSLGLISNAALAENDPRIRNDAATLIGLSKTINEVLDRKLPAAQRKKAIAKLKQSGTAAGKCIIEKISFSEPDLLK
ncbi:MAG TPA: hypothetical protein DCZ94_10240 [Lentisphaeria bacterium]|nr:MAG: hypothetical protein A2X48_11115 [Lentisphaerae bacterium GWF2_49_21]HBC87323.1 hypothetical protein [Lentisphaeria bacterium]